MHYFVTGATGFIGKRLVAKLLERKGAVVYFLVREKSAKRVDALLEYVGRGQGPRDAGPRRPRRSPVSGSRRPTATSSSTRRSRTSSTSPRCTT